MAVGVEAYRRRMCARIPLTTLATAVLLLVVYLFVQDGITGWTSPISIPYRAWGYRHLEGMLLAPLAHVGPAHLVGNLIGLLIFGTILEATVGHYPPRRGAVAFRSPRLHPWIRALLIGPGLLVTVGIVLNAVALGPTIGFSTVVFWVIGVLVVLRPAVAVVGLLVTDAVRLGYLTVAHPRVEVIEQARFVIPWFAEVALQAHAVGLLAGILVGIALRDRGAVTVDAPGWHVGAALVLVGVDRALWAVFFYQGEGMYVLYRGVGVIALAGVAVLVVAAVTGDARARAGVWILLISLAAIAVPYNIVAPTPGDPPDPSLSVGPYAVSYAEGVSDASVGRIPLTVGPLSTDVTTSGVIVEDPARGIWITAIGARELAFEQRARIPLAVGGERVEVEVISDRWRVQGNDSAYHIYTVTPERAPLYASAPSTAAPIIAGQQLTLTPTPGGFELSSAGKTARLPPVNETVELGAVRVRTEEDRVIAMGGDARVTVFSRPS